MNDCMYSISFYGYICVAVLSFLLGMVYTLSPKIMPYHLQALGMRWESLSSEPRCMLVNFQRSVAAGFLTTGIALLCVLVYGFAEKETWSVGALFIISLQQWGNITLRTACVKSKTKAKPPICFLYLVLVLIGVSFAASIWAF